jgi:gas vesicle protein
MSDNKNKGLAVGAAIGAVVGVITGILFAPKSGKETRQDIKDTAVKLAAKLQEEAIHLQEELAELIKSAEAKAKEAGKNVSTKLHELTNQAKHAKDSLTTLAKSVKAGEAEDKDLNKAIHKAKEAKDALAAYLKK